MSFKDTYLGFLGFSSARWFCWETTHSGSSVIRRQDILYVRRHQDVEAICCSGYDHPWDLRMPVKFFQVLLSLFMGGMNEWVYRRNERMKLMIGILYYTQNKVIWREITWWTKRSCGGRSSGAFTFSFVWALNSASSSSSFSKERSHILEMEKKKSLGFN